MPTGKYYCGYNGCQEVLNGRQQIRHMREVHGIDMMTLPREELRDLKKKCKEGRAAIAQETARTPAAPTETTKVIDIDKSTEHETETIHKPIKELRPTQTEIGHYKNPCLENAIEPKSRKKKRDSTIKSRLNNIIDQGCIIIRIPLMGD